MGVSEAKASILNNRTALGIEFGSTRIKAVLVDETNALLHPEAMTGKTVMKTGSGPTALRTSGRGFRTVIRTLAKDVQKKYGVELESVGAIGISAMMHGYMPFDREGIYLYLSGSGETTSQHRQAMRLWSCSTTIFHSDGALPTFIRQSLTGKSM